jgi:6-phosphogluconolactonase (cycloisomerase 2 family)
MSTRFTWIIGFAVLVSIGLLVACGSNYKASEDGLIIVPSQGQDIVQSFSFNLNKGNVSTIHSNPLIPGPPDQGFPASIVLDPTGSFAYVTSVNTPDPASAPCTKTSVIATFAINSEGSVSALGSTSLSNNLIPVALAMDSAGKYLYVANSSACVLNAQPAGTPGTISVFSVGTNASLTEIAGSPFGVPAITGGGPANLVALALTPTLFNVQYAPCTANQPPTTEYMYVADAENNGVWQFSVNTSSGVPTLVPYTSSQPAAPAGSVPSGVAVDPCNRFVYVSNQLSNNVSGYIICNKVLLPDCPVANGSLAPVVGSPFPAGNGPGPLVVSPQDTAVYVLDKSSTAAAGEISAFKISYATGSLSPLNPATVTTGNTPVSIAIRSDNNWLFVTNNGSTSGNGSVSQYSVTPATGALAPSGTGILTDTYPWGLAVK